MPADLGAVYARWVWCRALLHRGWWLVTSVYLVVDAHLPAERLVLNGVAQAAVGLAFEVPAGVLAGSAMLALGLFVAAGFRERRFVPAIAGHAGLLPALAMCAALLLSAIAVVAVRTGSP